MKHRAEVVALLTEFRASVARKSTDRLRRDCRFIENYILEFGAENLSGRFLADALAICDRLLTDLEDAKEKRRIRRNERRKHKKAERD